MSYASAFISEGKIHIERDNNVLFVISIHDDDVIKQLARFFQKNGIYNLKSITTHNQAHKRFIRDALLMSMCIPLGEDGKRLKNE